MKIKILSAVVDTFWKQVGYSDGSAELRATVLGLEHRILEILQIQFDTSVQNIHHFDEEETMCDEAAQVFQTLCRTLGSHTRVDVDYINSIESNKHQPVAPQAA